MALQHFDLDLSPSESSNGRYYFSDEDMDTLFPEHDDADDLGSGAPLSDDADWANYYAEV
tara:strand:+ start:886 stop:1065 length:180 start_codon:yes stop_codon:yes gene_type:complete